MPRTASITLGATCFEMTPDPVANNVANLIPKTHITNVTGVFAQKPVTATPNEWIYPHNTITSIQLEKSDGSKESIELQDVSNQATWSTGTLNGLNQAIADINAWL